MPRKPRADRPDAAVIIQIATRARGVPAAGRLRAWTRAAARPGGVITLRVVGAGESRRLNRRYRRRDKPTNVLSFGYARRPALQGDLVLCHPVISAEARQQGKSLDAHYAHLVIHGTLHLRGHRHNRIESRRRMEGREIALLARLGFDDPYGPR
jgi:probable rRNA maturation factor